MSESTDRKLILPAGDSRLNEFIRRAGPIITAERGLNEQSRLKLKSLASSLKMPDALFDLALEYFQQSGIAPKDSLTRFEREFWKWLQVQFRESKQKILSTDLEQSCLKFGTDKHQLGEERARQLIHEVARELGIQRVSLKEAESYLKNLTAEQIGSATILNEELRERLYRAATSWGVEQDAVDTYIENQLAENAKAQNHSPTSKRTIALGLAAIFIGTSLYLVSLYQRGKIEARSNPEQSSSALPDKTEPAIRDDATVPVHANWTELATQKMLSARSDNEWVDRHWNSWIDPSSESRIALMAKLFDRVLLSGDAEEQDRFVTVQSLLLQVEPLESALEEFASNISQNMSALFSEVPENVESMHKSFEANRLAYEVWKTLAPETEQANLLGRSMYVQTGFDPKTWVDEPDSSKYLTHSQQSIAHQWLDAVVGLTHNQPATAAQIIGAVDQALEGKVESELRNDRINEALLILLELQPELLSTVQPLAKRLIGQKNAERLTRWTELLWSTRDEALREWLSKELSKQLDIDPNLDVKSRIAAIRKQLNRSGAQPIVNRRQMFERWLESDEKLQSIVQGNDIPETSAQLISDVASWATGALALSRDRVDLFQRTRSSNAESLFEATSRSQASKPGIVFGNAKNQPRGIHLETLNSSIQTIRDQSSKPSSKADALRRIFSLADRFDDIQISQARVLMQYLNDLNTDDEVVLMRKGLGNIKHWSNLLLALIEQVESNAVARDRILTISNLLTATRFQFESDESWKSELHVGLLKFATASLQKSVAANKSDERLLWNRLEVQLQRETIERFSLLSPSYVVDSGAPYVDLNRSLTMAIGGQPDLDRTWAMAENMAENELHFAILVGRVLIEQAALKVKRANPQIDNKIVLIQSWHKKQANQLENFDQQLLLNEITLLKIWATACQTN